MWQPDALCELVQKEAAPTVLSPAYQPASGSSCKTKRFITVPWPIISYQITTLFLHKYVCIWNGSHWSSTFLVREYWSQWGSHWTKRKQWDPWSSQLDKPHAITSLTDHTNISCQHPTACWNYGQTSDKRIRKCNAVLCDMSAQPTKYITACTQRAVTRPPSSVVTTSLPIQEILGFRFYRTLVVLAQPFQVYTQNLKTAITLQFSEVHNLPG